MSNKHLTEPPTDIAIARLKVLLENVNDSYRNKSMVVDSDIVSLYNQAINIYFESIDGSIINAVRQIYPGAPADPDSYNLFLSAIQKDLNALFAEIGSLDKLVASSFNSILAEKDRILFKNKSITNKVGDYLLYSDSTLGGGFFFGDSFNIAERIDSKSKLLEGDECFIDFDEGIVQLPLDGDPVKPSSISITVNKPSNGIAGNNHEINVAPHNEIDVLSDGEPNTWFEYEKVTTVELLKPLILDITIEIEQSIINHININPINFGTRTPVIIKTIETSKDGKEYVSIKDEVPLKDFTSEQEQDDFILSSSTSKSVGQGFYSFLPRRVKFVHLVFEQHTPYIIDTSNGERLRYAIGLRDINILSRKFKTTGSIISTKFSAPEEIKKLSLWASENPTEASTLADIKHFVSHDDGAMWLPVQPQGRDSFIIPEVINYNNDNSNSTTTTEPVVSLRHKILIERNKDSFSGNAILKQERVRKSDLVPVPIGSNTKISLTEKPIKQTVLAILPFFGSFSCPRPRAGEEILNQSIMMDSDSIEFNVDSPATDTIRFRLPYKNIPYLEDKIRVFVNGAQIEYSPKDATSLGGLDEHSKVYFLNRNGLELQFGTTLSGDQKGFIPASGSKIQILLDGDNPYFTITDLGYVLNLTMPSDNEKDSFVLASIKQLSNAEAKEYLIDIPSGSKMYIGKLASTRVFLDNKETSSGPFKSNYTKVDRTTGHRFTPVEKPIKAMIDPVVGTLPDTAKEGLLPPVFLAGQENFEILEYNLDGTIAASKYFDTKVEFINGDTELDSLTSYTFNYATGSVYLGSPAPSNRRVVLKCKKVDITFLDKTMWDFYRDPVSGKLDTQKILVNPKAVFTQKIKHSHLYSPSIVENSIVLFENTKEHDWFNKKIIKGTVVLDKQLFTSGAKPVEVPFVDGTSEFSNKFTISEEEISFVDTGSNIYSYTLKGITSENSLLEPLAFAVTRGFVQTQVDPISFVTRVDSLIDLSNDGDWTIVANLDGTATVYLKFSSVPPTHSVSYSFFITETGLDSNGLYSIDYFNNIVYFAKPIVSFGTIEFDVSLYSAFYNIAEKVIDSNIEKIDESTNEVVFKNSFTEGFLKLYTSLKSRPQMIKLLYEYYEKSTESLKDLEPYFSPICKDIAFKAITIGTLNEL
jgi:hypothetical protein